MKIPNRHTSTLLTLLFITALLLGNTGCKKEGATPGASLTAIINNNSISFSTTVSTSNGFTIIQGSSSNYSITIVLQTLSPSIFTLGAQSTGYYATVADNFGDSYSTDAANTGQITLTTSSATTSRYNGTFYFTANETAPSQGGGNVMVTNGTCGNI
jgi:hypothetical protein